MVVMLADLVVVLGLDLGGRPERGLGEVRQPAGMEQFAGLKAFDSRWEGADRGGPPGAA